MSAQSGVLIEAFGKLYTGGDVKAIYNGHLLVGINGLSFGTKQGKENSYGMSREPVGRILKKKEYSGSFDLKAFEVDALEVAAGGSIEDLLPTNIPVVFFDPESAIIKTYLLMYVEFTGTTWEVKGSDDEIILKCELAIGGIRRV